MHIEPGAIHGEDEYFGVINIMRLSEIMKLDEITKRVEKASKD